MVDQQLTEKLYKTKDECRLCGSNDLLKVIHLGDSPISEKYTAAKDSPEKQVRVPLDLYFCNHCTHVQLIDVVDPDYLWADFTFKTSNNRALVSHFDDYALNSIRFSGANATDLIVDIGSNDGTLLKAFQKRGLNNVLGVDPAEEIATLANSEGVPTIIGYLNFVTTARILEQHGKAKIVTANNVYAHVDDLSGMTKAITRLMRLDGVFIFEVSYLLDVVQKNLIGTIFHEHLCYHSIRALIPFLDKHGLKLLRVERGKEQGGSIVCYAQFKEVLQRENGSVSKLLDLEEQSHLGDSKTLVEMSARLETVKAKVRALLNELRNEGHVIAGFGAARAGTTLLSYFEIGELVDYLVDDNEGKHYRYSPGDQLQVLPTAEIYSRKPDYLLILAWIHADNIIKSHARFLENGGAFIRIFPEVEVIQRQ
jgi:SAM-dependent methyltransferase